MSGVFDFFDFTKPGKGVDPNEPEKHPFFLFWELIWRKLSRLAAINVIYFLSVLPMLVYAYTVFYSFYKDAVQDESAEFALPLLPGMLLTAASAIPMQIAAVLLVLSLVIYGPATCGLTYVLRNFAVQKHAWISDFFQKAKENFKRGLAIGLLEIAVFMILFSNITMVLSPDSATDGMLLFTRIVKYASVCALVFLLFARHYLYVQIVTFNLTVRQIMKNSCILAVLGLFRNLFVTLIIILTGLLIISVGIAELLLMPFFIFSFWGFLTTFMCWPVIKKYVVGEDNASSGN